MTEGFFHILYSLHSILFTYYTVYILQSSHPLLKCTEAKEKRKTETCGRRWQGARRYFSLSLPPPLTPCQPPVSFSLVYTRFSLVYTQFSLGYNAVG